MDQQHFLVTRKHTFTQYKKSSSNQKGNYSVTEIQRLYYDQNFINAEMNDLTNTNSGLVSGFAGFFDVVSHDSLPKTNQSIIDHQTTAYIAQEYIHLQNLKLGLLEILTDSFCLKLECFPLGRRYHFLPSGLGWGCFYSLSPFPNLTALRNCL